MELLYFISVTSCSLFEGAVPGPPGSMHGHGPDSWQSLAVSRALGSPRGFFRRVVMEMQSVETAVPSLCECISTDRLHGGLSWQGARQLQKMLHTFALDSLVEFTRTISALMISCFQVCIHFKGLTFYKNCMGGDFGEVAPLLL